MDRRISVPCCLLLVTLIVLASAPPAHPWGAFRGVAGIKRTDTHQQIIMAAYALLMKDQRFTGMTGIPAPGGAIANTDGILFYEGVDGSLRTLAPYGPGPDAEGSTLYSCHWFNPLTGRGLGPESAADWYSRFLQALLGAAGGDEEYFKGLAWSAHFLSDMFVPYHLVGIPANEAIARIAAQNDILPETEAGPAFLAGMAVPGMLDRIPEGSRAGRAVQAVGEWWREGWGVGSDFRNSLAIFEANHKAAGAGRSLNHLDWFDPWYWNGTPAKTAVVGMLLSDEATDPGRAVFSSHASYESWAHGRFLESGGYKNNSGRSIPYDPLWKNPPPDYTFAGTLWQTYAWQVQDFAARIAQRSQKDLNHYWSYPDYAITKAIEAVYTMWRSAFSALQPIIQVGRDPARPNDGLVVQVDVRNHAFEPCHDARVRLRFWKSGSVVIDESQSVAAPVSSQAPGRLTWFVGVDPNEEWTVAAEAVGAYDITPDLQYSQSFLIYRPDPSERQARPVEEADTGDFVGVFVHTDPLRSYEQYHGEIIMSADGTFTDTDIFTNGSEVRRGSGIWKFDPATRTILIDWQPGGEFSGPVSGNTADFTISGRWSDGGSGTLRFLRR